MRVKILGSAAGGAFPQWNCACANCRAVRAGTFHGKPRTQTQIAITEDGRSWFLLGASPDLRAQIEATPELHPRDGVRHSPIAGIALANADLDHVLGLLLLRELQPLRIHATASVRRILREDNSMFGMLHRIPDQAMWTDFESGKEFSLCDAQGEDSGLRCRAWSLGESLSRLCHSRTAIATFPRRSFPRLLHPFELPARDLPICRPCLKWTMHYSQRLRCLRRPALRRHILERRRTHSHAGQRTQTARQMGHVPVENVSCKLAGVRRPRKIFLHINNTNPMLDEASPEYRQVRDAGWEIAEDGWQFNL